METPIHKIILYVTEINNNNYGIEDIKTRIENALDNEGVHFEETQTKDAGKWDDNHPLNYTNANVAEIFEKLSN